LQLLLFATLAFFVLKQTGFYPAEELGTVSDTVRLNRFAAPKFTGNVLSTNGRIHHASRRLMDQLRRRIDAVRGGSGDDGLFASTWSISTITFWAIFWLGTSSIVSSFEGMPKCRVGSSSRHQLTRLF
jgi:hypothetical protein